MESWENKILADKLNSLQDFPAGYAPDLSAKWEIIEAGLPNGKKRRAIPLLVRWSVAAAVLLGVAFLWVNDSRKPGDTINTVAQQVPVHQKQVRQDQLPKAVAPENVAIHPLSKPATIPVRKDTNRGNEAFMSQSSSKITIARSKKVKPVEELAYQPSPEMATIPVSGDTNQGSGGSGMLITDSLFPATVQQTVVATTLVEKRPAKKKIYQRDFNDGVLAMDTSFSPSTRQHFSIRLNPFARKTANEEPPVRRLQLKQAL